MQDRRKPLHHGTAETDFGSAPGLDFSHAQAGCAPDFFPSQSQGIPLATDELTNAYRNDVARHTTVGSSRGKLFRLVALLRVQETTADIPPKSLQRLFAGNRHYAVLEPATLV